MWTFVGVIACLVVSAGCGGGGASPGTTPTSAWRSTLASWRDETVGPLRLGMRESELVSAIGEPTQRGEFREMEATGERLAEWSWPALGVDLVMVDDGGPRIASIALHAPSSFLTGRGVGLGTSYDDVVSAYLDVPTEADDDPRTDATDHGWVRLGNAYAGLSFTLEDERVTGVFLGSTGAE
jgi:hypothetical protein